MIGLESFRHQEFAVIADAFDGNEFVETPFRWSGIAKMPFTNISAAIIAVSDQLRKKAKFFARRESVVRATGCVRPSAGQQRCTRRRTYWLRDVGALKDS